MKSLDFRNPEDWGYSPLSDAALRSDQFRYENPELWEQMISDDSKVLSTPLNPYDKFESVDDIPNCLSHSQFLAHLSGDVDPNLIWRLGEGDATALDEITDDWRVLEHATRIFKSLVDMKYWDTDNA